MEKKIAARDISISASQSLKEKEYWLNRFAGDFENVGHWLPYDYKTGNTGKRGMEQVIFRFDREVFTGLKKIGKAAHPKIYMILAAGLQALIYKYTGARDIMVCTPIYRQKIEADFINTMLILRNQPGPHITFKDLLLQVRDSILEAVENQNYPIENLLYDLNPSLFDNGGLVIDTAILLENIHDPEYIRHVLFNCCFSFSIGGDFLELSLRYNSSLYKRSTMERMTGHYNILLKEVLSEVNVRLSRLNILSREERDRLLYDFNRTGAEYPRDTSIHELFAAQVQETPGRVAVTYEKNSLSYRELDKRSDGLAGVLIEKGVRADTIVGIMAGPSLELIVAILGILKAGGAYLPIDPDYPRDRVDFMLKDSNAKILLTGREIADIPPAPLLTRSPANPSNLAYVIYTSGSTGGPKGVSIEHRGILNYIYWRIACYAITAADVSLQLVSAAFDGFCSNLYPALLTGGRTVLLNLAGWMDVEDTRAVIRREAVTHFSVVPSVYGMLLEGADGKDFGQLRFVVLAGEKASVKVIKTGKHLLPRVQLINEYGPTENSVATTANMGITPGNVSVIGTPISNNRIFILGESRDILPIGVVGELCVSGSSLARGYLNNPELTDKKFLRVGQKLYKTGDLARWLPDGSIEISGRIDHQVQVRGGRIEPEEIEKHLQKHRDIKNAVVVVKKDKQGDTYLCAYIENENNNNINVTQFKEFLLTGLPDFMVPARFVRLEKIPLNINGKTDRKLLTEMELTTGAETRYIAPRDEIEKKLAAMWEHLLETGKVGIRDNFFNIGGDSIKVISLLNSINRDFGTNLKAVDLYENETIEKVAAAINKAGSAEADQTLEQAEQEIDEIKNKFMEGL